MRHRSKQWAGRIGGSRGATLVEYALITAALVVVSILAIDYMSTEASDEVANQADCVSKRPPPPECQIEPILTTTTSEDPSTTSSTFPTTTPSTDPPSTDPPPPPNTASWTGVSTGNSQNWTATATITVQTAGGQPAAGVAVRVQWRITDPNVGEVFYETCVTDASGVCSVQFTPPYEGVGEVTATVDNIDSDPPVTTKPDPLVFGPPS